MTDDQKEKEIESFIDMIDAQMDEGVSRLSVRCRDDKESGILSERRVYGKRDSWNPWNWGESEGS